MAEPKASATGQPGPRGREGLLAALLKAQGEFPTIPKNATGQPGNYKYAELPTILENVGPVLRKHGLVLHDRIEGERLEVCLDHAETGETEISSAPIPGQLWLEPKKLGAFITYMRRYITCSMLGIAPDDDVSEVDAPKLPDQATQRYVPDGRGGQRKAYGPHDAGDTPFSEQKPDPKARAKQLVEAIKRELESGNVEELAAIKASITQAFVKGEVTQPQHEFLIKRLSLAFEELGEPFDDPVDDLYQEKVA